MKRVVVTGLGVVSCLGNNQEEVYKSLLNAKSGITFAEEYKEYNLKSHVHGKPNIKLEDHVDRKFIRFMGPGSAYNYISMNEAVKDSGLGEGREQHIDWNDYGIRWSLNRKRDISGRQNKRKKSEENGAICSSKNDVEYSFSNSCSAF